MALASSNIFAIGFLLCFISGAANADSLTGIYNVSDYGAVADGQTDSTKAFGDAWSAACAAAVEGQSTILIPAGSFLVGPLVFSGPCKGVMTLQLIGQLLASTNLQAYTKYWIEFQRVTGLIISGGGIFNGQGALAWSQRLCPVESDCPQLPMSVAFTHVTGATITGISSVDSKFFHIYVFASTDINFERIKITAPGDSPNTDGIHVVDSTNVCIADSVIGTGDDCVSVGAGNANVTISDVACGPGHGISVGSLGKGIKEKNVVGVTIRNCTLSGTRNGLRIKTWQSSPCALNATGFVFQDVVMNNVQNPIVIDQKYCPYASCPDRNAPSLVKITDVKFRNIRGTYASPEAIKFVCSDLVACQGVELSDINLQFVGDSQGANVTSTCVNVYGSSNGNVNPQSCLCTRNFSPSSH